MTLYDAIFIELKNGAFFLVTNVVK